VLDKLFFYLIFWPFTFPCLLHIFLRSNDGIEAAYSWPA